MATFVCCLDLRFAGFVNFASLSWFSDYMYIFANIVGLQPHVQERATRLTRDFLSPRQTRFKHRTAGEVCGAVGSRVIAERGVWAGWDTLWAVV